MSLPAIPTGSAIQLEQVDQYATTVEVFAHGCDDIGEVQEVRAKWAAVTEYIKQRTTVGVARAEAAHRVLEARIGELIIEGRERGEIHQRGGNAALITAGGDQRKSIPDLGLSHAVAARFIDMAENPDIVAEVIAESDDSSPPSGRKIERKIRQRKIMDNDARLDKMRAMAEAGNTSRQIAEAVGLTGETTRRYMRDAGIPVPADKLTGLRTIDPVRIIEEMISSLEALASTAELVDAEHLRTIPRETRDEWAALLRDPLATINKLRKDLTRHDF